MDDAKLLARVAEVYAKALAEDSPGRRWLAERGLTNIAVLEKFGVGWADGNLSAITPKGDVAERLRAMGLVDPEMPAGSVTVPLTDALGQLVAIWSDGRVVGIARGGWLNAEALRVHSAVAITTDPIEALRRLSAGGTDVVAAVGDVDAAPLSAFAGTLEPLDDGARALLEGLRLTGERIEITDDGWVVILGPRRYRVNPLDGGPPGTIRAVVRAQLRAAPGKIHLDRLDLAAAKERAAFARQAAITLGQDPRAIGQDLARLAELSPARVPAEMTVAEREEATAFLRAPDLLARVERDLTALGVVGEETNKLLAYLVATSRLLPEPLSLLLVSRSAAGKSTLVEAVARLMPPEATVRLTRLTGEALFHRGRTELRHRVLVLEEESGIREAQYPLRVLQSARRLAVARAAGSQEVEGPVAVLMTTTRSTLNDETRSRFLVASVDESREQTRRIQEAQRRDRTPEGRAMRPAREAILRRHHNAQRLLRALSVVNPLADRLRLQDDRLAARREQPKLLALVEAVALLFQYQRKVEGDTVIAEEADVRTALRLAEATLRQGLDDLSPPARRLLAEIGGYVREHGIQRFTRRQVREALGWSHTAVYEHLRELEAHELVVRHGRGRGRLVEWELLVVGRLSDGSNDRKSKRANEVGQKLSGERK